MPTRKIADILAEINIDYQHAKPGWLDRATNRIMKIVEAAYQKGYDDGYEQANDDAAMGA